MKFRITLFLTIILISASSFPLYGDIKLDIDERFPTEEHKIFPLAEVHEIGSDHKIANTTVAPYKEPLYLETFRKALDRFLTKTFPLPESDSDVVEYALVISHIHGLIPQGSNKLEKTSESNYADKFVYEKGRLKNYYSLNNGREDIDCSIYYDDEHHLVIIGKFYNGKMNGVHILEYSHDMPKIDVKEDLIRAVRFAPDLDNSLSGFTIVSCSLYNKGKKIKSIRLPNPLTVEPGKWPCQARRYFYDMEKIAKDKNLTNEEKVDAIFPYMYLKPLPNEEQDHGGFNYPTLRWLSISSLGDIQCEKAYKTLIKMLNDKDSLYSALEPLGKYKKKESLSHLIKVLDSEDYVPQSFRERNKHLISAKIADVMYAIAFYEAKSLIDEFLTKKERVFAESIRNAERRAIEEQNIPH